MEKVLLLPGDGIGPEVVAQARRVLEASASQYGVDLDLEEAGIGGNSIDDHGTPLREEVLDVARQSKAILLGAVGGPRWDDLPVLDRPERGLLRMRSELGLFANLRPASVFPALVSASTLRPEVIEGIDMLVLRELTGGLYFGEPRGIDESAVPVRACNSMVYD